MDIYGASSEYCELLPCFMILEHCKTIDILRLPTVTFICYKEALNRESNTRMGEN